MCVCVFHIERLPVPACYGLLSPPSPSPSLPPSLPLHPASPAPLCSRYIRLHTCKIHVTFLDWTTRHLHTRGVQIRILQGASDATDLIPQHLYYALDEWLQEECKRKGNILLEREIEVEREGERGRDTHTHTHRSAASGYLRNLTHHSETRPRVCVKSNKTKHSAHLPHASPL